MTRLIIGNSFMKLSNIFTQVNLMQKGREGAKKQNFYSNDVFNIHALDSNLISHFQNGFKAFRTVNFYRHTYATGTVAPFCPRFPPTTPSLDNKISIGECPVSTPSQCHRIRVNECETIQITINVTTHNFI